MKNAGEFLNCLTSFYWHIEILFCRFIYILIILRYDWVEIHDGMNENDPLIGNRLCGAKRPAPIVSSGNTLFMHFHSDNRGSAKGFKVRAEISRNKN